MKPLPSGLFSEAYENYASPKENPGLHPDMMAAQSILLHAWTRQLVCDYEGINADHLGGVLRTPIIEVSPTLGPWGRWDPTTRRLSIKLRHITDYSWASVLETLKHEMAHQYVHEALGLSDVMAHGDAWRRACGLLGISPAARGDGGVPIAEAMSHPEAHADPKLRKVRKLLALAENNPNENEVQAALDQAREYLLRHNLDLETARAGSDAQLVTRWLGEPVLRVEGHRYRISNILDAHFFVSCIWVPTYIAQYDRPARQLEVCGQAANVEMAEYVHDTLLRHLHVLWDSYRKARGVKGVAVRNAYWDGLLAGFSSQLARGRVRDAQQGLVWQGDARLEQFFRRRHPRVRTAKILGRRDSEIRRDGIAAGKNLQINRPISNTAQNGTRAYLPAKAGPSS